MPNFHRTRRRAFHLLLLLMMMMMMILPLCESSSSSQQMQSVNTGRRPPPPPPPPPQMKQQMSRNSPQKPPPPPPQSTTSSSSTDKHDLKNDNQKESPKHTTDDPLLERFQQIMKQQSKPTEEQSKQPEKSLQENQNLPLKEESTVEERESEYGSTEDKKEKDEEEDVTPAQDYKHTDDDVFLGESAAPSSGSLEFEKSLPDASLLQSPPLQQPRTMLEERRIHPPLPPIQPHDQRQQHQQPQEQHVPQQLYQQQQQQQPYHYHQQQLQTPEQQRQPYRQQQQTQHYQQPRGLHHPPQRPPQPLRGGKPLFQSIWQKVEQGLDSLAHVEDFVADRASQISHQVRDKAKDLLAAVPQKEAAVPHQKQQRQVPRPASASPQRLQQQQQQTPGQRMFGSPLNLNVSVDAARTEEDVSSKKEPPTSSLAPLYSMHSTFDEKVRVQDDTTTEKETQSPQQPVFRAGGSESSVAVQQSGGALARKMSPFMQLQQEQTHQQAPQTHKTANGRESSQTVPMPFVSDSLAERVSNLLPPLPRLPSPLSKLLGRGSGSHHELTKATLDVWEAEDEQVRAAKKWFRKTRSPKFAPQPVSSSLTPPLTDLLSRCNKGKTTMLLSAHDQRQCRSIGRSQAVLDMTSVALLVAGSRQVLAVVQDTVFGDSIEQVIVALRADLAQGWTFFLFAAALLTMASNFVINGSKIQALATEVGEVMQDSTLYAQLYLRLAAGQPVDKNIPGSMEHAAVAQALDLCQSSRLQSFALFTLSTMVLMTVSIIKPIVESALEALIHLVTLPELRSWPVPWSHLGTSVKEIFASMGGTVLGLVSDEVSSLISKPMAAAFQLSTFVSILVVSFIPTLEHRTKVRTIVNKEDEEDEILSAAAFGTVATLSSLGVSSASRLGLLSKSGALEGTLERWRATLPPSFSSSRYQRSIVILLRRLVYTAISSFILFVPFFVHFGCFAGVCAAGEGNSSTAFHFDSILDVSILLLFALRLSWQSIAKVMDASAIRPYVLSFVKGLGEVVEEVSGSQTGVQSQLGCSISPTLGLSVKDLWAAHTSKRAWAVRGASFECHSGEVVAILGEDGAGKSRLLTAVAEALVFPVKRSLTTTKVRGVVSHSGLDASKWNRDQLKKRLGIFLNDVRTIADNADFMSGFTVEEMLEPLDALLTKGKSQQRAASRAVSLALQITGLSTSLLPRLPLKLATAVTANENELTPSELRPRCYALSPSEWSKVMLTRVLAQTLFDNNAVSGSPLVGSILLLDDLTAYMSELDEVRIIQALRKSGAATIFTTQKWASGRLADRIVVMKDGAVVESGSHGELLARGPQQSLYAAKWHAMTAG